MSQMRQHSVTMDILFSRERLRAEVTKLAIEIRAGLPAKSSDSPLFVGVLNGAFMFFADLIREFEEPLTVDFIKVASYQGMQSGPLNLVQDVKMAVEGRDVVIVEDIVDSGKTLTFLKQHFEAKGVKSLTFVSLFLRDSLAAEMKKLVNHHAITLKDEFVIGYGLDLDQKYRNLPHVYEIHTS